MQVPIIFLRVGRNFVFRHLEDEKLPEFTIIIHSNGV